MDCSSSGTISQRTTAAGSFIAAELIVWRQICRREWPKAEFEVLRLIVACSLGLGRKRARIPSLNYFVEYTGQAKPHVSVALASLKARGVIEERPEGCYALCVLFGAWRVPEMLDGAAVIEQLELLPPAPELNDGALDALLEGADGGQAVPAYERILPGLVRDAIPGGQPERGASVERSPQISAAGNPVSDGRSAAVTGRMAAAVEASAPPSLPGARGGASADLRKVVTDFVTAQPIHNPGAVRGIVVDTEKQAGVTKSVTVVTDSVTPGVFPPQTPPSGPVHRLAVPVPMDRKAGTGSARALVTREEERRLFALIQEFVGEEDAEKMRGMYLCRAIRNFPDVVDEALGWARTLEKTGYAFEHRGRWLTCKIAKLAGVGSLSRVGNGPPPTR